jgi:hypothetical protein
MSSTYYLLWGVMQTESTHQGPGASPYYAYNARGLSALEFLYAVMNAQHLPMSTRMEAAKALLPFTNPYPRPIAPPAYTIVIPPLSLEPWSEICSPWPRSTANDSQNPSGSHIPFSHGEDTKAPVNFETNPEPSPLIDYFSPPTPEDLQAIKAVVNKLRPDLAHLPTPEFHLCPCGHWITGTYPCCEALRPRDGSKLN